MVHTVAMDYFFMGEEGLTKKEVQRALPPLCVKDGAGKMLFATAVEQKMRERVRQQFPDGDVAVPGLQEDHFQESPANKGDHAR